ncbi:MAG: large-conductance mechanosensitive channel protein MscL [Gemmataceae bacterium]
MGILEEFKKFIMRGNVIDMAVGIIIGTAFGGIVSSMVSDVLMPPIASMTNGVDFSQQSIDLPGKMLDPATKDKPEAERKYLPVKVKWGLFLQKIIDFLIMAACLFLVIKGMNAVQKKKVEAPPEPSAQEKLLTEIRDLLKKQPT